MWGAWSESQTCTNCEKKNPFWILQVKTHRKDCHGSHEWKETSYNIGNSRSWTNCAQHVDDNEDTIEDDVRFYLLWEHSWRWIQGEAIVKIVREKNRFLLMKTSHGSQEWFWLCRELVKNVKKNIFFILQMKTHITGTAMQNIEELPIWNKWWP